MLGPRLSPFDPERQSKANQAVAMSLLPCRKLGQILVFPLLLGRAAETEGASLYFARFLNTILDASMNSRLRKCALSVGASIAAMVIIISPVTGEERGPFLALAQKVCSQRVVQPPPPKPPSVFLTKLGFAGRYRGILTEIKELAAVPEEECAKGVPDIVIISQAVGPGIMNLYVVSHFGVFIRGIRFDGVPGYPHSRDSIIDISSAAARLDFENAKKYWISVYH